MKKIIVLGLSILVLAGCTAKTPVTNNTATPSKVTTTNETTKPVATTSVIVENDTSNIPATSSTPSSPVVDNIPTSLPNVFELKVPFAPQAPFSNWDAVHEETCEEASMIMGSEYVKGQSLGDQAVEDALQKLLKWEADNGYKVDITSAEAVKILGDYFGVKAKISSSVTVERIKSELVKGNLIIIPAAGRELNNPNFKAPGPIYHMLVIKGYDTANFITNDPGTRKGNGYKYPYQTLLNAIHDWNPILAEGGMNSAEMLRGAKVMIVVSKP